MAFSKDFSWYDAAVPLMVPVALAEVGIVAAVGYGAGALLVHAVGKKKFCKLSFAFNSRCEQVATALSIIFGATGAVGATMGRCLRHLSLSPRGVVEPIRTIASYSPSCIAGSLACAAAAGVLYSVIHKRETPHANIRRS